ncbi:MAG: ribonuclease P [Candidatus Diapherotrites archaeon]|uniref:Ribonuclease P protein component 4 n=1 Tax=Candidatus Iainarchaeum sp. TaxID=3101447 RepID=A0A8T3YME2_9ARCH|nr:ribonuclease P [Candidatus Diapherotrites archaeon]
MKHAKMQELGTERIWRLFELAEHEFGAHPERSKRYVEIARGVSKKLRARIPDTLKTKFCKKCGAFFGQGNSKITRTATWAVVKCLECGHERKTGRKPNTNK